VCNSEETYVIPDSSSDLCNASLRVSGPPNSGGGGAPSPSLICWQSTGPGTPPPNTTDLNSGTCDPEIGCSARLVLQLDISPANGNPEDDDFFDWWHGEGWAKKLREIREWNEANPDDPKPVPIPPGPTWTPAAGGNVTWGPPAAPRDPTGDSVPPLVIELKTDNCSQGTIQTICAIPASGSITDQVCISFLLECSGC
jgi:hypothetical protein